MPQRVVIIYTCSLCQADTDSGEKMRAYQLALLDAKGEPGLKWTLDVCATCEENDARLRALLDVGLREGKMPKARVPTRVDATEACPECGERFTPQGLGNHRSKAHGVVSGYAAKKRARGTGKLKCPECQAEGIDFGSDRPQGLAAHRSHAHGYTGRTKVAQAAPAKRGRPRKS